MKTQEDSDIEKRLLFAILLSMAILFVTPYIYEHFYPTPEVPAEELVSESPGPAIPVDQAEAEADSEDLSSVEPAQGVEEEVVVDPTEAEARRIVVEGGDLIVEINTVGGVIIGARMAPGAVGSGEVPLELIPQGLPDSFERPLATRLSDPVLHERIAAAVFEVEDVSGNQVRAPATISMVYRDAEIEVRKRIRVPAEGYVLEVEQTVLRGNRSVPYSVVFGTGIGETGAADASDFMYPSVAYYQAGAIEKYAEDDLDEGVVSVETTARWAGIDSKYFSISLIAPESITGIRMERREWTKEGEDGAEPVLVPLVSGSASLTAGSSFSFFLGPKKAEVLGAVDPTLKNLIDYGWFAILVKPLLVGLTWIYGYVGNYGWAIILLTFLINVALFPIRYKQMASMQKMSALQPKLRSIQDKYKRMKRDDPRKQQMNAEVMALYKQHGVNPLGGCLPLLLQMPILFAFYRMLDASIELRGAPFMLWIQDLSHPDPYYVTPLVMGLTMVAQQKMTPATGDPAQRRMMMMLPIVFTFFFLGVSSGLAIYFLFSNVFAMMLQLGLKKLKPELGAVTEKSKSAKGKKK
ncbi:MAG: membrane protein insertase YidC [Acidobacteriota bacterium]|nr:MAG: membrane protein insertase YidC [Acidobacteriota bacterium]